MFRKIKNYLTKNSNIIVNKNASLYVAGHNPYLYR